MHTNEEREEEDDDAKHALSLYRKSVLCARERKRKVVCSFHGSEMGRRGDDDSLLKFCKTAIGFGKVGFWRELPRAQMPRYTLVSSQIFIPSSSSLFTGKLIT